MGKTKIAEETARYLRIPVWLTGILILANVGVYLINTNCGMMMTAGIVVYIAVLLLIYYRRKAHLFTEMVTFASQYGQIQRELIMDFDLPYALTDGEGRLLWFNRAFADLTGKDRRTYHRPVTSLFSELTPDLLPDLEEEISLHIRYAGKSYLLSVRNIPFDDFLEEEEEEEKQADPIPFRNSMFAIFLHDETELNEAIRRYQDEALVAGLLYVDNYEEALESVEAVRRSLLMAMIERRVTRYFSSLDAIVTKFENDKYMIVMRNSSLRELKAMKFNILEEVKKVNVGNEMAVTLSIGIGANQGSYVQNMDHARGAIDLALGRGGDQVVVRDGESITYFGGKSLAVERSTRVKARIKAHALAEFITGKERVVIMGHRIIDIDAFGAAVGIYRIARTLNKPAHIVVDDPNSSTRPFIDLFRSNPDYESNMLLTVQQAREMVDADTLLVVVDTNKPDYTECEDLLHQTKDIVVLDHHRQGNETIRNSVLSYIEPYASSACEMVSEILQYFTENVRLRGQEADTIYAGILLDTDNFVQRTGVRTFEAAAYLRRCGADVTRVRKMFREDLQDYQTRGEVFRQAEIYRGHYAISVCPSDHVESPTVVGSQAANELLNIIGVKASFVLTDYKNSIYISARAIDEVNVQIIMEKMGGGGHLNMAGCQLAHRTIPEARDYLKQVLDEMEEGGEIG